MIGTSCWWYRYRIWVTQLKKGLHFRANEMFIPIVFLEAGASETLVSAELAQGTIELEKMTKTDNFTHSHGRNG